jgi:hypothetical protein
MVHKTFRFRYHWKERKGQKQLYKNLVGGCDYKNLWKVINYITNDNKSNDIDGIVEINENGTTKSGNRKMANCLTSTFPR